MKYSEMIFIKLRLNVALLEAGIPPLNWGDGLYAFSPKWGPVRVKGFVVNKYNYFINVESGYDTVVYTLRCTDGEVF